MGAGRGRVRPAGRVAGAAAGEGPGPAAASAVWRGAPDVSPLSGQGLSRIRRNPSWLHATASLAAVFLGEDLLTYLVLALGAAMVVGNGLALVRPPEAPREGDLSQAPPARSLVMIAVGLVAAVWALASLVSG